MSKNPKNLKSSPKSNPKTPKTKATKIAKSPRLFHVAVVFLALVLAVGLIVYAAASPKSDAERFSSEYTQVPAENPYLYRSADEIINILSHGTGVVFLGFPECPWCQAYAGYLADVAKSSGVEKIYYYNIFDARRDNTAEYQEIVNLLADDLDFDDEGRLRVYVPQLVVVKNGEIIFADHETAKDTLGLENPAEYWSEDRVAALKSRLETAFSALADSGCETTCDK